MSAKIINLVLEQGTDFQSTFTIYNENGSRLNLTNYTANSVIKKHPTSSTSFPFTISFPNRAQGKVMVSMARTDTTLLSGGRYVYDVMITSPTNTTLRVVQGSVLVTPGVSL
tara:strand:- start:313 stop:648 length:336 start_codon:yes stop_codon:yes gene_type:complete